MILECVRHIYFCLGQVATFKMIDILDKVSQAVVKQLSTTEQPRVDSKVNSSVSFIVLIKNQ